MRTRPNIVILNDTSTRYHHGCARVMEQLTAQLEARGLNILHRVPARADWEADAAILDAIRSADLIIVNGEGTLHHGKEAGKALLRIAACEAAANTPKALINTLYESNPLEWEKYLSEFDIISARDSVSANELSSVLGPSVVRCVPDLSMSTGAIDFGKTRKGIVIGDSVKWDRRRDLALAARGMGAEIYAPTKTLSAKAWLMPGIRHVLYMAYNGVGFGHQPRFVMPRSVQAYLDLLARSEGHLTGRFHAVCLSMVTGTPFLALASNASKIERLLLDAGLDRSRLLSPSAVRRVERKRVLAPFSEDEKRAISTYLAHAKREAETLFDDLADRAHMHWESMK